MIDQDVVDCLDKALSLRKRAARVDSASMAGGVKDLVIQFERRAGLIVSRINAHLPAHQKCPVYIFFCEAEGYGAFALRDRYDYVVLNLGLAPTLTEFFLRMMATPGLWPSVGEQKAGPAARAEPATEYFPAHLLWKSLPSRMPDDPLRRAFAVIFMSECLDFIVRHEFAHLVLGHVVAGGQTAAKSDPIVTQALELAADGHAAIWGLDPLQQMPSMLGRSPGFVDDANRLFHRTPDGDGELSASNFLRVSAYG